MAPVGSPSPSSTLPSWSGAIVLAIKTLRSRAVVTSSDLLGSLENPSKTVSSLVKRQTIVAIPTTYTGLNAGPDPGTVAGIVLGSVGGLLLVLWLIYTCFNLGGRGGAVGVEEVVHRRSRSPRRSRRSETRSEVIEVSRRSRTPPPPRNRRETIIIEESRRPAPVSERREDDIVEVIEEHSPPPPRRSRRASGYRNVDPNEFAGGRDSLRHVRH